VTFTASPNFTAGRGGRAIDLILLHYTASLSMAGTVSWFQNPASQVSAHYVIGRDGSVVQMVHDADIAWHAGREAVWQGQGFVNGRSIGIELVGTAESGFTAEQLGALWVLLTDLCRKYQVRPDRVVGHHDVLPAQKIDPDGTHNQFPWPECRGVAHAALVS
jgi:N-acetylmuramoyl-L-alanine amidase